MLQNYSCHSFFYALMSSADHVRLDEKHQQQQQTTNERMRDRAKERIAREPKHERWNEKQTLFSLLFDGHVQ